MGHGKGYMSETAGHDLSHLSAATARLGHIFARPKVLAGICVITLAALGWLYLALLSAGAPTGSLGGSRLVQVLCGSLQDGFVGPYAAAVVLSMWCAMTLAMMLPSAAPMILTYTEIADTAARKRERIVSPFVLFSEPASVRHNFCLCRHLSILDAQARMSHAVPASVSGFLHELGHYARRSIQARSQARPLLCRLLLGDDAFDVRCRSDEYRLDGRDRHRHDAREDAYGTTLHSCHRCSAYCDRHRYRSGDPGRRLVIANKLK
jgi:hypothetical protein